MKNLINLKNLEQFAELGGNCPIAPPGYAPEWHRGMTAIRAAVSSFA